MTAVREGGRCRSRGDLWLKVVLTITGFTGLVLALSFSGDTGSGPRSSEVGAPPAAPVPVAVTFASSAAGVGQGGGGSSSGASAGGTSAAAGGRSARERTAADFVADVAACKDLACLRAAHAAGRGGARFSFPHFFIVGWQKTATTSLWKYLQFHPEVIVAKTKEPEFFTRKCNQDPAACPPDEEAQYVGTTLMQAAAVERGMAAATCDGSTHYARAGGEFPARLLAALPWLKVIASMREPISRAISHVVHAEERRWGGKTCLADQGVVPCIVEQLNETADGSTSSLRGYGNYSYPLSTWLAAFPRDQILVLQYERLGSEKHQASELRRVKSFLGLDPEQGGETMSVSNERKSKTQEAGWLMRREDYESLVALVRPDSVEVARLLEESGQGDGSRFLKNWEDVWRRNLETCDSSGQCAIQVS